MPTNVYSVFGALLVGWLTTVSLVIIGYLAALQISDWRRHRRMTQRRHQLGLG